ncbi:MAG: methylmalonyl Co-A mutase-associated GTPase MeaB [Halobacteria archaeon]
MTVNKTKSDLPPLLSALRRGDKRAVARLITLIENDHDAAREIVKAIYPLTGKAHIVGVTGPPGAGKSTLIDVLVKHYRKAGKSVAVVAVDVSSPFTGGAFLGDRLRMASAQDPEVFVRSMGSRGAVGGLARATRDAIRVLDAAGRDVIFVETVGTGQDEVDIMNAAHTCLLVAVPGLGDEIQASKAGSMEIADLFVVNKSDREGADKAARELQEMVHLGPKRDWTPPVLKAAALKGEGVAEVASALEEHRRFLGSRMGEWRRRTAEAEVRDLVRGLVEARLADLKGSPETRKVVELVAAKKADPYTAAEETLRKINSGKPKRA